MYQVIIRKSALKVLDKIPDPDYTKIKKAIAALVQDPRPIGYIKLHGRSGYRIRQGNYRIIYEIVRDMLIVEVIAIGHRQDIYD